MKKAELLRSCSGKLTTERAASILSGKATRKPRGKSPAPFKLKHKVFAKYFTPESKATSFAASAKIDMAKATMMSAGLYLHCRQLYPLPTVTVHKNRRPSAVRGSERRHIVRQGTPRKTCRYLW